MSKDNAPAKAATHVCVALTVYALLLFCLTTLSWAIYQHHTYFEFRPVFAVTNRLNDLLRYTNKTAHLYHNAAQLGQGWPPWNYPAPAAFVYKFLLYSLPGYRVLPYMVLLASSMLGLSITAYVFCRPRRFLLGVAVGLAFAATAVLNEPLVYGAYVANIEWTQWVFSAVGVWFLLRRKSVPGAILIGLAASIKPFPILYLLLLIRRRKFEAAGWGITTAVITVLAALFYLGPNPLRAYRELKPGVNEYVQEYVLNIRPPDEARFLHSLLDGAKSAAVTIETGDIHSETEGVAMAGLIAQPGGWSVARRLAQIYPWIAVPGLGFVFVAFYNKPLLNQLTALAVAVVIFPPSSAEYTLLTLCIPFWAFVVFLLRDVVSGRSGPPLWAVYAVLILYALLFSPLTFLELYAGDAKLLLCLALLLLAASVPMRSEYFEGRQGEPDGKTMVADVPEQLPARYGSRYLTGRGWIWRRSKERFILERVSSDLP